MLDPNPFGTWCRLKKESEPIAAAYGAALKVEAPSEAAAAEEKKREKELDAANERISKAHDALPKHISGRDLKLEEQVLFRKTQLQLSSHRRAGGRAAVCFC